MKVANLLNPRQANQGVGKVELVFNIADDLKLKPRRILGKAACELREAETGKRRSVPLPGR